MSVLRRLYCSGTWKFVFSSRKFSSTPSSRIKLGGIYPPLTTPFDGNEKIAFDKLADNITKYSKIPFAGYVVMGSNGEFPYLEKEERLEIVKFVKQIVKESGKPLIAGSGCESTKATIHFTEKMAKLGADAVMVITPHYFKNAMKDSAMISFYTSVADASPVPVILYSVPKFTGVDISVEAIQVLANHPNIIGIKESAGDVTKIGAIVHKTKNMDFKVLSGSASFLLPSYVSGSAGGICALANVLGDALCSMHSLFHQSNTVGNDLLDMQRRLIEPNDMVTGRYGVAGMKTALDIFGYYGGQNRAPMQGLNKEAREILQQAFVSSGFSPAK